MIKPQNKIKKLNFTAQVKKYFSYLWPPGYLQYAGFIYILIFFIFSKMSDGLPKILFFLINRILFALLFFILGLQILYKGLHFQKFTLGNIFDGIVTYSGKRAFVMSIPIFVFFLTFALWIITLSSRIVYVFALVLIASIILHYLSSRKDFF